MEGWGTPADPCVNRVPIAVQNVEGTVAFSYFPGRSLAQLRRGEPFFAPKQRVMSRPQPMRQMFPNQDATFSTEAAFARWERRSSKQKIALLLEGQYC